jgi:hypothetical protein
MDRKRNTKWKEQRDKVRKRVGNQILFLQIRSYLGLP